jgi:hypothetical protein
MRSSVQQPLDRHALNLALQKVWLSSRVTLPVLRDLAQRLWQVSAQPEQLAAEAASTETSASEAAIVSANASFMLSILSERTGGDSRREAHEGWF